MHIRKILKSVPLRMKVMADSGSFCCALGDPFNSQARADVNCLRCMIDRSNHVVLLYAHIGLVCNDVHYYVRAQGALSDDAI